MNVLVTGSDGFVGHWLVRRLEELGHGVIAAGGPPGDVADGPVTLDVTDPTTFGPALRTPLDAVVHLAALSSGSASYRNPAAAWSVNAVGTALLASAVGELKAAGAANPLFLYVSTAEVYGMGHGAPRRENDPIAPCSPYAASKAAGEIAALEVWRRTGLRVVVARAFPHTGPGQDRRFVAPAFAERLRIAKRRGAPVVKVGRLEPIREVLDVRDVVEAYLALLAGGDAGETYNICGGEALSVGDLFQRLAGLVGSNAVPEVDANLTRATDIRHLVGDATKIRAATGWRPRRPLTETLADLVRAQAD